MAKRPAGMTPHAKKRMQERSPYASSGELAKAVRESDKIIFVHRQTHTRSLIYIQLSTGWEKCVINRKRRQVITVLPWKDTREASFAFDYDGRTWDVVIYPDAFLEVGKPSALTRIKDRCQACYLGNGSPRFNELHDEAWKHYQNI